ncbi:hypothetical protein TNCV_2248061 [Trichonephila clavipes]|nr:hypothetical protein TNCV_2248061 [Trichonephila clavipes]
MPPFGVVSHTIDWTAKEWNEAVFSEEYRLNLSSDGNSVRMWRPVVNALILPSLYNGTPLTLLCANVYGNECTHIGPVKVFNRTPDATPILKCRKYNSFVARAFDAINQEGKEDLGSNPGEGMYVCKCIVPLWHGGTLNSRQTASPFMRLMEGKESPSSVSWGKLPTRTTQPTFRIRTLTFTFAGQKEDTCSHSLLINAERDLIFVMAWSADLFTEY